MRWEWFKNKELGFLTIWSQGTLSVVFLPVNNTSAAKKEGFSSSHCDGWWKMDLLQQRIVNKVMRTARSCFYVVGSVEYSRCEGYAVYLVGPGRYYLLWAVETEWNHHWGTVSNAIDASEPSTVRKKATKQRHEKVILQHDNARLHVAKPVETYLETLKWEVLSHLPYSPDNAPSDYYLFRSMAHDLADQQFRSFEDIEKRLDSWITSKDEHFYRNGIRALPGRWAKAVANDGQYF